MTESNKPKHALRLGALCMSIWENRVEQNGQTTVRYSATLNKRYRDKNGEWKDSNTFFPDDLYRIALLAQKTTEWIELKEENPSENESADTQQSSN